MLDFANTGKRKRNSNMQNNYRKTIIIVVKPQKNRSGSDKRYATVQIKSMPALPNQKTWERTELKETTTLERQQ